MHAISLDIILLCLLLSDKSNIILAVPLGRQSKVNHNAAVNARLTNKSASKELTAIT